jgi:hypothetical protein
MKYQLILEFETEREVPENTKLGTVEDLLWCLENETDLPFSGLRYSSTKGRVVKV